MCVCVGVDAAEKVAISQLVAGLLLLFVCFFFSFSFRNVRYVVHVVPLFSFLPSPLWYLMGVSAMLGTQNFVVGPSTH